MHIIDLNSDGRENLLFYEKKRVGKIYILLNTAAWKSVLPAENTVTSIVQ